jgi:hypothetical protein
MSDLTLPQMIKEWAVNECISGNNVGSILVPLASIDMLDCVDVRPVYSKGLERLKYVYAICTICKGTHARSNKLLT